MQHITRKIGAGLLASALMCAPALIPQMPQMRSSHSAQAAEMMKKGKNVPVELEPWPGRRVVLLLPLQLGVGFNADREFGNLILPRAEAELAQALEATGKFSVLRVHRFSPLVQRGLFEKRVTEEQVRNVTTEPVSIDSAMTFLSQYTFEQAPMVADFRLEEVRSSIPGASANMKMTNGQNMNNGQSMKNGQGMKNGQDMERSMVVDGMMGNGMPGTPLSSNAGNGSAMKGDMMKGDAMMSKTAMKSKMKVGVPSVQAQVSGRLYQVGEAIAYKAPVVTSMSVQQGNNNIERYLLAASDAFMRIARQFTAPLEDIALPTATTVPATSVENATTPISGDTSTAVTTPDPDATDTTSPVPIPPDATDNGPIEAPKPDNPVQGNPVPNNAPAQAP